MIETPQITQTVAQRYACLHLTVPAAEIRQAMGPGLREVHGALAAQGFSSAGPWFTHHFKRPGDFFDFEICVPLDAATPFVPEGRVQPGAWPSMRVVRTVYHGAYEGLGAAWGEFEQWIAAQGLNEAQDLWEVYRVNPDSGKGPGDWRTELNRPLID